MSAFGDLLKIVAIGAFFIATGPFGLTVGSTLATALRIGGMVLGYLGAVVDRPKLLDQTYSMALDPGSPLPVIYGRAKVSGIVDDWLVETVGPQKVLYMAVPFAHGSSDGLGIASVDEIWIDGTHAVTVSGDVRTSPYTLETTDYQLLLGTTAQNAGNTLLTGLGVLIPDRSFAQVSTNFETGKINITTSAGPSPVKITTSGSHGYTTGDSVRISGHTGTLFTLNRVWVITVTSGTQFTLNGSTYTGAGSGGTAVKLVSGIEWSATTDTGKGVALGMFRFLNVVLDADRGPTFHGPPGIAFIVRGVRVWDTRTSLWVSGGDNPAMCIRDYLLAPIYGCGFGQNLIHEQSFKDAADYCDTLVRHKVGTAVVITSSSVANPTVITTATPHGWASGQLVRIAGHAGSSPSLNADYTATVTGASTFTVPVNVTVGGTGGTVQKLIEQKRYTCNGVVDTGRDTGQNLEDLKSSCRGNLIWEQGQYKLTIRSEVIAAPTVTLSPANIVGEWSFRNAGLEEKWNTIHATYIDPMNGEFQAQSVQWPLVGTTNAYLAADNSFTNTLDLVLPFTNDQLMAQMTAQVTLNESRLGISCSVRCTEEALALSVGDKVNVTHPTPGWTAKPFWVTALDLLPDTSVAVGLMEYDPTAYDLATQADRRTFPATSLDSIFEVPSPGAVTITSLPPQGILIAWGSANYGHIDYYDVQTRLTSAGDDYITIEHVRESGGLLQAIDARARPGQTWDARVRVVNTAGWPSEWVYASQITIAVAGALTPGVGSIVYTGFAPDAVATFTPPVITGVGRVATGGDLCADTLPDKGRWIHTVSWTTTGADDAHYQIDLRIARDVGALDFTEVAGTGYTTASSSATHNTGIQRNLHGVTNPFTEYAEYQVRVVRKSDGALMSSSNTSQGTITSYSDPCLA
jgi:hypothetical protein